MSEGGLAAQLRKLPNPPDFDIFEMVQGNVPQKTFDALERFEKAYVEWVGKVNNFFAEVGAWEQRLQDLWNERPKVLGQTKKPTAYQFEEWLQKVEKVLGVGGESP